jgi:hypothetical protein
VSARPVAAPFSCPPTWAGDFRCTGELEELADHSAIRAVIDLAVAAANQRVSRTAAWRRFHPNSLPAVSLASIR